MRFLSDNIRLTHRTTLTYYCLLLIEGADSYHAEIASQALARCFCESIPPNDLQRQSIQVCKTAIARAGIVTGEEETLF